MSHATCAHCGVAVVDYSTMVKREGQTFCCNNCAATTMDQYNQAALGTCTHCHVPIVAPSTRVEHNGEYFCCGNCAAAMPVGVSHGR
jgi:hypothetical protein